MAEMRTIFRRFFNTGLGPSLALACRAIMRCSVSFACLMAIRQVNMLFLFYNISHCNLKEQKIGCNFWYFFGRKIDELLCAEVKEKEKRRSQ